MDRALALAAGVRRSTSPNPWVGCVIEPADRGVSFEGATQPPGGPHAEIVALAAAADAAAAGAHVAHAYADAATHTAGAHAAGAHLAGATLYTTLEPCSHHGRTPPCTDAIVAAGIARGVVGIEDPDPHVAGAGVAALRAAGITVDIGIRSDEVRAQLAPYLTHRTTGRPYVVLKLAATLDGRTAAADGSSRWITGTEARADAHRLRAESDAVLVGAGTVRADDPSLTVRHGPGRDPLRIVLGHAPPGAKVHPALELKGPLDDILDQLGQRGVLQVLVEGGATVAGELHRAGLVDRYVVYLAPALAGGDDGRPLLAGPGAPTIDDLWRGRIVSVTHLGPDLRVELERACSPA